MKKFLVIGAVALAFYTLPANAADTPAKKVPPAPAAEAGKMPMHERAFGLMQADTDKDGKVSKAEFVASAEQRFAKMDKNGDGFIDQPELQARRQEMRERMKEHRQKMEGMGDMHGDEGHESHTAPPQ